VEVMEAVTVSVSGWWTIYREVLVVKRRVLGPEHPDTLTTANNLAHALDNQGKHAEAATLFREAIVIQRRVLGPEHPGTLATAANLAACSGAARSSDPKPLRMRRADDILRSQPYVCARGIKTTVSICVACAQITINTCWCTCACTSSHKAALLCTHAPLVFHRCQTDILYSLQLSSLYFPTHASPMYEVEVEHGGAQ
jgi:hypothetical protein